MLEGGWKYRNTEKIEGREGDRRLWRGKEAGRRRRWGVKGIASTTPVPKESNDGKVL